MHGARGCFRCFCGIGLGYGARSHLDSALMRQMDDNRDSTLGTKSRVVGLRSSTTLVVGSRILTRGG
jgi:hypothetical protein